MAALPLSLIAIIFLPELDHILPGMTGTIVYQWLGWGLVCRVSFGLIQSKSEVLRDRYDKGLDHGHKLRPRPGCGRPVCIDLRGIIFHCARYSANLLANRFFYDSLESDIEACRLV
jgi:hypothetical protein